MKVALASAALLASLDAFVAAQGTAGKCGMPNLTASEVLATWHKLPKFTQPSNEADIPYDFGRQHSGVWYSLGAPGILAPTLMVYCGDGIAVCPWATFGHCAISAVGKSVFYYWTACTDG